jgi:hypothetical protein
MREHAVEAFDGMGVWPLSFSVPDVSGQLQAPGKLFLVPTGCDTRWAPESVWALCRRENPLFREEHNNRSSTVHSVAHSLYRLGCPSSVFRLHFLCSVLSMLKPSRSFAYLRVKHSVTLRAAYRIHLYVFRTCFGTHRDFRLCSVNWLVFITETESVYCAVRTGCVDKTV